MMNDCQCHNTTQRGFVQPKAERSDEMEDVRQFCPLEARQVDSFRRPWRTVLRSAESIRQQGGVIYHIRCICRILTRGVVLTRTPWTRSLGADRRRNPSQRWSLQTFPLRPKRHLAQTHIDACAHRAPTLRWPLPAALMQPCNAMAYVPTTMSRTARSQSSNCDGCLRSACLVCKHLGGSNKFLRPAVE